VGQVLRMDRKELLGLRNFGQKSLVELYQALSSRELIPPGTPLDVPPEQIYGTEGAEDEGGEAGYVGDREDEGGTDTEPEGYMEAPGANPEDDSVQVVDALGTSEGSFAMSRGIYVDDEYAGAPIEGGDETGYAPDTVENRQLDKNGAETEA
jgi:hypothetical protein